MQEAVLPAPTIAGLARGGQVVWPARGVLIACFDEPDLLDPVVRRSLCWRAGAETQGGGRD